MNEDFVVVRYKGNIKKHYKAVCATCNKDRGYKREERLIGNCKSCQKKINAGTLGVIKKCISCNITKVNNPNKDWFAGPTCNKCYSKVYRQENKEKIRKTINRWRIENKERHQASEREWRQRNKDHKDQTDREWRNANSEHIKIRQRTYLKRRQETDVNFKIARSLRHRLGQAVKNDQKVGSAVKDLGCSMEKFKEHIESLWQPGMNWDNWGVRGWHMDHIVPLNHFDLTDYEEVKKACHYTNIQPLWWYDNISKGAKVDE